MITLKQTICVCAITISQDHNVKQVANYCCSRYFDKIFTCLVKNILEIDACNKSPCLNGACEKRPGGLYRCVCFLGFEGDRCEQDKNPCKAHVCHNLGTCIYDTAYENNFSCRCLPGFAGSTCQIDIDECASSPCLNNGTCMQTDKPNDYVCKCSPKYMGKNCQIEPKQVEESICSSYFCQNNSTCKVS